MLVMDGRGVTTQRESLGRLLEVEAWADRCLSWAPCAGATRPSHRRRGAVSARQYRQARDRLQAGKATGAD